MKKATFEQAYKLAKELFSAEKSAAAATTDDEQRHWLRIAQTLSNKITPAAKQAAAPAQSLIANEALRLFRERGGTLNCSKFIEHCRSSGIALRKFRWRDDKRQLGDSDIRKIVRGTGITGKSGRPLID